VAYNRFVIVGPASDPARLRSARNSVEAFRQIAASRVPFVTRRDGSGTYEREQSLWAAAGVTPGGAQLLVTSASMAIALRHAHERQGYALSDEATFWQMGDQLDLVILVAGDSDLLNTYAVIHPRANRLARRLADWLTAGEGRTHISRHRTGGRSAFTVWPSACAHDRPEAKPCGPA
jgi:tungstate transport system substrate-binding protein